MAEDREIYPNAPLKFVAIELRFPHVPDLAAEQLTASTYEAIRSMWPIAEPGVEVSLVVTGADTAPSTTRLHRFLSKDRRRSLTLKASQLLVETTEYSRYEQFREEFDQALAVLEHTAGVVGISRVGLRYVDEVRIPSVERVDQWRPYVADELLGPLTLAGGQIADFQGTIRITPTEQRSVVMRYGALVGQTVSSAGPLRIQDPDASGPYFLVDIDSFWTEGNGGLMDFSRPDLLGLTDELHVPVRNLFEASITERLRSEVLRVPRETK